MQALELLSKLSSLWFIFDTEDENKKPGVTRRDMISVAKRYFESGETNVMDLWDYLCDNALECPINRTVYNNDLFQAFAEMDKMSVSQGELSANTFIHALNEQTITPEFYHELCMDLATSLNISTDENDVDPEFWTYAFNDEMTPLGAVISASKVHAREAHIDIMEYLAETDNDYTEKQLTRITGKPIDIDGDYVGQAISCLSQWNNKKLQDFYNELLNKNCVIID